jgi:hypothetical protein
MTRKSIFYLIAVIFLVCWSAGFFFFHAGLQIHTLLFISVIFCLQAVILIPKIGRMAKYSKADGKKAESAMEEGQLPGGRHEKRVSSRQQAIVIGLSEALNEEAKPTRKRAGKKQQAS